MAAPDKTKKTTKRITLVNGGTTPLVYDDEGHVIAAGQRLEVPEVGEPARLAAALGFLVIEESPADEAAEVKKVAPGTGESTQA